MMFRSRAGTFALAAWAGIVACTESNDPRFGAPARLDVVSGEGQLGVVGTQLDQPLVVRVVDGAGRPVVGHSVSFHVTAGSGSVFAGSSSSDELGVVRERWTLGTVSSDAQRVEARALDNVGTPLPVVVFQAQARAGPPAALTRSSGNAQAAPVESPLPDSLAVSVTDVFGNPVAGVVVRWQLIGDLGMLRNSETSTNADGIAGNRLVLGTHSGTGSIRASQDSRAVDFSVTATAGPAATISLISGSAQAAEVGTVLPSVPTVRVLDRHGNAVPNAEVHFGIIRGGGSVNGSLSTWITADGSGTASTPWTLGNIPGANELRAAIDGIDPATFLATAIAGPPHSVTIGHSGNQQVAPPGALVPIIPVATVRDRLGNGLAGIPVLFEVVQGDGLVTGGSTMTDANGNASPASWRLGTEPGFDTLVVHAGSLPGALVLAFAQNTAPEITIAVNCRVCGPVQGEHAVDALHISAQVGSSQPPIVSGRARVNDRSVDLTLLSVGIFGFRWDGTIDLRGLPSGPLTAILSFVDSAGNARDLFVTIIHDGS